MTTIASLDFEQLPTPLQELLAPRIDRLGYLGEWFRKTAHQAEALEHFHRFTEALKGALPTRLVEVVALTVAASLHNDYERHQHEQLCRRLGYGDTWVQRLVGVNDLDVLSREEAVVHAVASSVARNDEDLPRLLDESAELFGDAMAIGILLLSARYVAHALVARALQLQPPVSSTTEVSP